MIDCGASINAIANAVLIVTFLILLAPLDKKHFLPVFFEIVILVEVLGLETIVDNINRYFDVDTAAWFVEELEKDYDLK